MTVATLPPRITSFSIGNGNPASMILNTPIVLFLFLSGTEATEVRVSETSLTFPEPWAGWRALQRTESGAVIYPAPGSRFQDATPGRKTVFIQVRGAAGTSALASDSIDVVQPAAPPVPATYIVSGSEAYELAQMKGFGFSASFGCRMLPEGIDGIELANSALNPGLPCDFELFKGRELNVGWSYVQRAVDASVCHGKVTWVTTPSGRSLAMKIRVEREPLKDCLYYITSITLSGPAGSDWKTAFNQR